MVICKHCGTEIEDGLVYCPNCGQSILENFGDFFNADEELEEEYKNTIIKMVVERYGV